jgi:hypothetical protein
MPAVKGVGEPCAREPHARFDVAAGGNQASRQRRAAPAPPADPPEIGGLGLVPARTMRATAAECLLPFTSHAIHLFHGRDLAAVFRFDAWEFGLAVVALLTVALIGVRSRSGSRFWIASASAPVDTHTHHGPHSRQHELRAAQSRPHANRGHGRACRALRVTAVLRQRRQFPHPGRQGPPPPFEPPNVFVLDVVGMHDIDFTGARVLNDVLDELDRQHITFALTRAATTCARTSPAAAC